MLSTLGDSVESFIYRLMLRLLQAASFVLYGCGWFLERAGPPLLRTSDKLQDYVKLQFEEADNRPDYRSEVSRPEKGKVVPSKECKVDIKKPPQPEDHPGEEVSKTRISQLSTDPGIAVPEEVTQPDQSCEETSSDESPATIGDLIKSQIKHDERHLQ